MHDADNVPDKSQSSLLDHKPTHQTAAKQEPTIDKEQDAPKSNSIAQG